MTTPTIAAPPVGAGVPHRGSSAAGADGATAEEFAQAVSALVSAVAVVAPRVTTPDTSGDVPALVSAPPALLAGGQLGAPGSLPAPRVDVAPGLPAGPGSQTAPGLDSADAGGQRVAPPQPLDTAPLTDAADGAAASIDLPATPQSSPGGDAAAANVASVPALLVVGPPVAVAVDAGAGEPPPQWSPPLAAANPVDGAGGVAEAGHSTTATNADPDAPDSQAAPLPSAAAGPRGEVAGSPAAPDDQWRPGPGDLRPVQRDAAPHAAVVTSSAPAGVSFLSSGLDHTGTSSQGHAALPRAESPAPAVAAVADGASVLPASPATTVAETAQAAAPAAPGTPAGTAAQLANVVFSMHRRGVDGTRQLTVDITPEHLGPVRLTVTIRAGEVHLLLGGSSELSREALRSALPELRKVLEAAGLVAGAIDVHPDQPDARPGWAGSTGGSAHDPAGSPAQRRTERGALAEPASITTGSGGKSGRPPASLSDHSLDLHL